MRRAGFFFFRVCLGGDEGCAGGRDGCGRRGCWGKAGKYGLGWEDGVEALLCQYCASGLTSEKKSGGYVCFVTSSK